MFAPHTSPSSTASSALPCSNSVDCKNLFATISSTAVLSMTMYFMNQPQSFAVWSHRAFRPSPYLDPADQFFQTNEKTSARDAPLLEMPSHLWAWRNQIL